MVAEEIEFGESKKAFGENAPNEAGFMNIPDGVDEELPSKLSSLNKKKVSENDMTKS